MKASLLALAALFPISAAAQVPTPVQTSAEAITEDAGEVARQYAIPLVEAEQRLRAQEALVATTTRLTDQYRDRLAGIVLQQRPDFRLVVLLTGDAPEPDQLVVAGGLTVPISFRTGASATRDQLLAALTAHQTELRAAFAYPPAMGVDPRGGTLVVMLSAAQLGAEEAGDAEARLSAIAGVPVRVRALDRQADTAAAAGGARVVGEVGGQRFLCTSGFVVTDGRRTGVATAAHCPDELSLVGPDGQRTPLPFLGQWGWGYQDVQINLSADPLPPLFYADTAKTLARPVETWRNRSATIAGNIVCHRGERTGYSCAEVELTDFAPSGDLCGGACLPRWVTVAGPSCGGGDSGAPVFSGTVAFGIVKGASYRADGSCGFYYYMSTDYLPEGWSLLYQRAPLQQPADDYPTTPNPVRAERSRSTGEGDAPGGASISLSTNG